MTKARYLAVLFLALALAVPTTVWAQAVSKGSIQGTVEDATGAVVPGAKVTVTSSFGTREVTTEADGTFLILALEPGTYQLKVEAQGFKTASLKDVVVRLNERSTVSVKLEPGAVTEIVEVSETGAGVDLSTTTVGANIPATIYYQAPVGRNISEVLYLAPGANDSLGVGRANPSISGATGFENMYIVNGVNITNSGYGAIGTYSNVYGSLGSGVQFDFVKEVQVKTSGFEAQYGQALGGVVNLITKSGGNEYHGGGYAYFAPDWLETERRQPNDLRFNRGQETIGQANYDFGGELGGYVIKDRLFWYGGYNFVLGRSFDRAPDNFRAISLGTEEVRTKIHNYSVKVNGNLTADQNHQLEFSLFGDPASQPSGPNRQVAGRGFNGGTLQSDFPERAVSALDYGSRNMTVRYNGVIRPTWLVNASWSWAHNEFTEKDFPDVFQVEDRTEATLPSLGGTNPVGDGLPNPSDPRGINQVGGIGFYENNDADNYQWAANGTNTFRVLGSHQVDYGFQYEDIDYAWFHERSGPDWIQPCIGLADINEDGDTTDEIDGCNVPVFGASLRLRVGGPAGFRFQQIRGAYGGREGSTSTKYGAIYGQDAWSINKYITLKLGLRWEQQKISGEGFFGEGAHYTFAGNWAPRAGILIDPTGRRKTKIFFNYGRFFEKVPQDLAVRSLSNELSYISQFFAITNPLSPNPAFNSAVNPTPGCPASTPATLAGLQSCLHNPDNWILDTAHFLSPGIFAGGVTDFIPGTKNQMQDEYVVGMEHEFKGGVIVSGRYIDRRIKRIVEDVAGVTVGAVNTAVGCVDPPACTMFADIHQVYLLGNPSASLDAFHNTLCVDPNEDPTVEDQDPNSPTFTLGCLGSGYLATSGEPDLDGDGLPDGFPDVSRVYRAFELQIEKRFTRNWQLLANWRIATLDGNYEGLFRNDNAQTDPNITSLFDFVFSDSLGVQFEPGPLPTDRRHVANIYTSYLFDNGFNFGAGWRFQTGYPIDHLAAHPAYLNQGEIPVGGRGAFGRTDATMQLDLHGDYTWKVTERYRLKFVADLFNVMNNRRVQRVDRLLDTGFLSGVTPPIQPNPDIGLPTAARDAYQRPFFARFAVRLEF
ncbi:MAG TPA: TonB-dependent receptor [Candidatus Xenobia bacterium]|nr:TonB-dependent receptor [Candidatus Xenobia bacterium]